LVIPGELDLVRRLLIGTTLRTPLRLSWKREYLILKPKTETRKGWEDSFRKMHENGDDKTLMSDVFEDENFEEWK